MRHFASICSAWALSTGGGPRLALIASAMWGDLLFPILANVVSLLALSACAAIFHRVRLWRAERVAAPSNVLQFPAPKEELRDERRAA